jgi:hypothetical protein
MSPRAPALLLILLPTLALASPLGVLTAPGVGQVLAQQRNVTTQKEVQPQSTALAQDDKPAATRARGCDSTRASAEADTRSCRMETPEPSNMLASSEPDSKRTHAE